MTHAFFKSHKMKINYYFLKNNIMLMGVAVVNMVAALVFVATPFFNVYVACILMMTLQKDFVVFVLKLEIFS